VLGSVEFDSRLFDSLSINLPVNHTPALRSIYVCSRMVFSLICTLELGPQGVWKFEDPLERVDGIQPLSMKDNSPSPRAIRNTTCISVGVFPTRRESRSPCG
jgi:hypothetical protein